MHKKDGGEGEKEKDWGRVGERERLGAGGRERERDWGRVGERERERETLNA